MFFGFLARKLIRQNLIDQFGCKEIGRLVVSWAEFHYVAADEVAGGGHGFQRCQHRIPMQATGLWSTGGRHDGGIKDVQIKGDIDAGL